MQIARTTIKLLNLVAIIALALPVSAHAQVTKKLTKAFEATLTNFQTSVGPGVGNYHFIQATVHFQNTSKLPLILGSDKSAFSATDEQGNRYGVSLVRGMGEASRVTSILNLSSPPAREATCSSNFFGAALRTRYSA